MKRNKCKICDIYSPKRKVCLNCKREQPFVASSKTKDPFKRSSSKINKDRYVIETEE